MAEVDLDRLEEIVKEAKAKSFSSLAFSMDTLVIDTLIRRVREAERDRAWVKAQRDALLAVVDDDTRFHAMAALGAKPNG